MRLYQHFESLKSVSFEDFAYSHFRPRVAAACKAMERGIERDFSR